MLISDLMRNNKGIDSNTIKYKLSPTAIKHSSLFDQYNLDNNPIAGPRKSNNVLFTDKIPPVIDILITDERNKT